MKDYLAEMQSQSLRPSVHTYGTLAICLHYHVLLSFAYVAVLGLESDDFP